MNKINEGTIEKLKDEQNIIDYEFNASVEETEKVINVTKSVCEKFNVSKEDTIKIAIIVEEVFVNIAHHAYECKLGKTYISFRLNNDSMHITFIDYGKPFNPIEYGEVDIEANIDEREIGGLGIHMVKEMSDDLLYVYDDKNIFTVVKKVK